MLKTEFKLQPSRIYRSLLAIATVLSCAVILTLSLSSLALVAIMLALLVYMGVVFWRVGLLRDKNAVLLLHKISQQNWLLQTKAADYEASLRGDSVVTRWLCVLRFQPKDRYFTTTCVVFPDSLANGEFREFVKAIRVN